MAANYFRVIPANNKFGRRKNFLFSLLTANFNVVLWLIVANVFLFVIFSIIFSVSGAGEACSGICSYFMLQPKNLFVNNYWWTLLTSMFMHANIFHLFANMFTLFFIGRFLENLIGRKRFFWLYIFSGIFAGLFFSILAFLSGDSWWLVRIFGSDESFAVGASGAIFALAATLALLTPKAKVYLILGPVFAIILWAVFGVFINNSGLLNLIYALISVYVVISIFSIFSFNREMRRIGLPIEMPLWVLPFAAIIPLIIVGFFVFLPIGNMAHLGGVIFGAVYGVYLKLKYKKKTKLIAQYYNN
jgi:membrane associated rhomboid family serine protease